MNIMKTIGKNIAALRVSIDAKVADKIKSDATGITAMVVKNEVVMLDTDYDALAVKDPNTIYNLYEV